jgi:hypothetical protein
MHEQQKMENSLEALCRRFGLLISLLPYKCATQEKPDSNPLAGYIIKKQPYL